MCSLFPRVSCPDPHHSQETSQIKKIYTVRSRRCFKKVFHQVFRPNFRQGQLCPWCKGWKYLSPCQGFILPPIWTQLCFWEKCPLKWHLGDNLGFAQPRQELKERSPGIHFHAFLHPSCPLWEYWNPIIRWWGQNLLSCSLYLLVLSVLMFKSGNLGELSVSPVLGGL